MNFKLTHKSKKIVVFGNLHQFNQIQLRLNGQGGWTGLNVPRLVGVQECDLGVA